MSRRLCLSTRPYVYSATESETDSKSVPKLLWESGHINYNHDTIPTTTPYREPYNNSPSDIITTVYVVHTVTNRSISYHLVLSEVIIMSGKTLINSCCYSAKVSAYLCLIFFVLYLMLVI